MVGQSGNPAGRPKGSRNRVSARCAELLGDASDAIIEKLIKEAKKGEPVALRLAVERLVPIRAARDRAVEFDLPAVGRAADLAEAAAVVIACAADGHMTLSEAKEFMALIEGQRKMIETTDLVLRLEALEGGTALGERERSQMPAGAEVAARVRRLLGVEQR